MSPVVTKIFSTLLAVLLCGIPTWIWLGMHALTAPQGFCQKLALGVTGLWFLGGLQFMCAIIFIVVVGTIWSRN